MPEQGINYLPKKDLLTFEEIERLITLLASMGISKVRFTGGEPFVRKDFMDLVFRIGKIEGVREMHLTTNGVLTAPYVQDLKAAGIQSINLSVDTLDRERFKMITRRDEFDHVMKTMDSLLEHDFKVKINAVVMEDKNIEDILPLVEYTKSHPVSVRFIEEMPFNGEGSHYPKLTWTYKKILEHILTAYPNLRKLQDEPSSTSYNYTIEGHQGNIGVIAAFSRTFCGTCNRIRITAQGTLKTCLYDRGVLNIRDLLRSNPSDLPLRHALLDAFRQRPKNGFEAELTRAGAGVSESMSTIGG